MLNPPNGLPPNVGFDHFLFRFLSKAGLLTGAEQKMATQRSWVAICRVVGMRGFEPPASRPPDVHSNRAELHPECFLFAKLGKCSKKIGFAKGGVDNLKGIKKAGNFGTEWSSNGVVTVMYKQ